MGKLLIPLKNISQTSNYHSSKPKNIDFNIMDHARKSKKKHGGQQALKPSFFRNLWLGIKNFFKKISYSLCIRHNGKHDLFNLDSKSNISEDSKPSIREKEQLFLNIL